jgi:Abnormal spindle-like microcephaly-assoc'd, ASPM-SPD-2-Hydin
MIAQEQGQFWIHGRKAPLGIRKNCATYLVLPALLLILSIQSGCSGTVGASHSASLSPSPSASPNVISGLNPSTSALTFGNVNLGTASSQVVTFTNTSSSNVTISKVTMAGAGFTASGVSNGLNLAPGASVAMTVSFSPAGMGPVTGSITITDTASNPTITIVLSGTGFAGHRALLSWNPSSSSNVAGYYIYRATTSGGPYSKLNWSSPNQGTTGVDGSVQSGQTYFYVVTAVDVNGLESSFSNEVSAPIP